MIGLIAIIAEAKSRIPRTGRTGGLEIAVVRC
jgi:hypothetical protein